MRERAQLVEHYGRELEWDFADLGVDVVDFWAGRRSWSQFDSFVERFELHPRSWLSWARANDLDAHQAAADAGLLTQRPPRIETFEWDAHADLLSGIFTKLQHIEHVIAQQHAKKPKRFRGKPWARPATALDELRRRFTAKASSAFMNMFEFVDEAEFSAEVAEHLADQAAGLEVTGPQQRALDDAARRITRGGLGVPSEQH